MDDMKYDNELDQLKADLEKAKASLEAATEELAYLELSRNAMLNLQEDMCEMAEAVSNVKKELEMTLDSISDPIFIHDIEFKLVRANRAYMESAGMEFKEFIGRLYYEVFPNMGSPFKMCLNAEEMLEEEYFVYAALNRTYKVRFYPINDANGRYLYSIHMLEDITEAKKAAERLKEEMEITSHLLMIAEATAHTTDIDKLMEQVTHCTCIILRTDISLSYLWNKESETFQSSHASGLPNELIPVFRTEQIDEKIEVVRMAMEGKEPGITNLESEIMNIELLPWLSDINTLAIIPLIGKTSPLGLIISIYTKATGIEERDKKIMAGISNQVSVALEQARLYKESLDKTIELSHKIETIKVMNQIDRSILSTLKSDELLETVMRLISKVIHCERATVSLIDRERDGFIYKAGFGTAILQKGAFIPFADTSAGGVVETGRTECVNNLMELTPLLTIEKRLLDEGFLSHIRVPITIKGDISGVLAVGAKTPAAFTKENLSTLEYLCSQIGVALSNTQLVSDLEELSISVVKCLSSAIDAKSTWTAGHSERVTKYALDIAEQMGLSEMDLKNLELAGLLHDVGKIGTYEFILDKSCKLTDEEQAVMRLHPGKGAEILNPIKQFKDIIPGVKYHHEFYDGAGYPDGLKGEAIPLYARILAVADTLDAMRADRPYRKGRTMEFIITEFNRCSGTQFDPQVVAAILKVIGERHSY